MDPLVSVSWLAAHLQTPGIVAVDASLPLVGVQPVANVKLRYRQQHIPGAVFFDIDALSDHTTTLPHMLPTPDSFGESMSALGLGSDMTLVVYEQEGVFSAPRAWWMLRTMGARKTFVLDGGLRAWIAAGYETESGTTLRPRACFDAEQRVGAVRTLREMRQLLFSDPQQEQILDARSAGRFAGTAPEPRPNLPSGHMPGSVSVPFTDLVQNGRLYEADALRARFEAHGVDLSRPITTTCGSGVTAAVLALALERCGVHDVKLYDGSWAEYARDPASVVVRTDEARRT